MTPATVEQIAHALKRIPTAGGYKCMCPAHQDNKRSLMINSAGTTDGRPTVYCYAGCDAKDIYDAIEAQTGFGFADRVAKPTYRQGKVETAQVSRTGRTMKNPTIIPAPIDWRPIRLNDLAPSKTWFYTDQDGALLFTVCRYETDHGKEIRPYSVIDDKGNYIWKSGLPTFMLGTPLYNLQNLLKYPDRDVLVVEGEKACDAVDSDRFVAVAFQGGTNAWSKTDWTPLTGRSVYLWPDNDAPGRKGFMELGKSLRYIHPRTLRVFNIPQTFPVSWDLADPWPAHPSGGNYTINDIQHEEGPFASHEDLFKSINKSNYRQIFDAMYYLIYDGRHAYTLTKQWFLHMKGQSLVIRNPQLINRIHPASSICHIDDTPAIVAWRDEKLANGDYYDDTPEFEPYGPYSPPKISIESHGGKRLNGFTGWAWEPVDSDHTALKHFLLHVICNRSTEQYEYLMNYLSHMVQHPEEKPSTFIVLYGEPGTGKTTLFKLIQRILGGLDGYAVKTETIEGVSGKFNSILSNKLFIWVEEIQLTRSTSREDRLKSFISDETISIERKGKDPVQQKNMFRIMGATNREHIWNMAKNDRRCVVFEVSEERLQDFDYFNNLRKEMDKPEAIKSFMYELSNRKIDYKMLHKPLNTAIRQHQLIYTLSPIQRIFYDWLNDQQIEMRFINKDTGEQTAYYYVGQEEWMSGPVHIPSWLTKQYAVAQAKKLDKNFIVSDRDRRTSTLTLVKTVLKCETVPSGLLPRGTMNRPVTISGRERLDQWFPIPSLMKCRELFAEFLDMPVDQVFEQDHFNIVDMADFKKRSLSDDIPF